MPFQQDLTGLVEPTAKTWQDATPAQRLWYYQQVAKLAERRKRVELMQAIGRYGVMDPRKHPRSDGASGPVMDPHGAASRAYKLLASSATASSCKLYWRAGGAVVSKSGTVYFTDILGFHADGLVRGAPVRDVRLSDDSIKALRQEGESIWRKRPKQSGATKPKPPATQPTKVSAKGPTQQGGKPFATILPPRGRPKPPPVKPPVPKPPVPKPPVPPPPVVKPPVPKPPVPKPPVPPPPVVKPPVPKPPVVVPPPVVVVPKPPVPKPVVKPPVPKPPPVKPPPVMTSNGPILAGRPIAERLAAYEEGDRKVAELAKLGVATRKLDAEEKSIRAELEKLNAAWTAAGYDQNHPGVPRMKEIYDRLPGLAKEKMAAQEAVVAEARKILMAPDPIRVTTSGESRGLHGPNEPLTPAMGAKRDKAVSWLEAVVSRGGDGDALEIPIGKIPAKELQRSYYLPGPHMISVAELAADDIYVHEIGHGLEYRLAGTGTKGTIQSVVDGFLAHRVKDEPSQQLNKLFPDANYGAEELGRKDHFDAVFGPGPLAYYVGKDYGDGSTEVLSMGIQQLYNDPDGFARADPEYAKFVIGILDGSLR